MRDATAAELEAAAKDAAEAAEAEVAAVREKLRRAVEKGKAIQAAKKEADAALEARDEEAARLSRATWPPRGSRVVQGAEGVRGGSRSRSRPGRRARRRDGRARGGARRASRGGGDADE